MAEAMRRVWLFGVMFSCGTGLVAQPATAGVPWRGDVRSALEEARAKRSPVWMQFTGAHCPSCRRMEAEVFVDPRVIALASERFVPVLISADVQEELTSAYGVAYLPTSLLLDPSGRVLSKQQGYLPVEDFLEFLRRAAPPSPAISAPSPDSAASASPKTVSRSRLIGFEDSLAIGGYCPVSLVAQGKLRRGSPQIAARYDGMVYRFADESARRTFLERPDPYVPVGLGRCPIAFHDKGQRVAGRPDFGAIYQSQLYVFADESARRTFMADPKRYADLATGDGGRCPHCRSADGASSNSIGKPEHAVIYRGVRYLVPNEEHRAAFLRDPRRYIAPPSATAATAPAADPGSNRGAARFISASRRER